MNRARDDLASERAEFDLRVDKLKGIHAEIIESKKILLIGMPKLMRLRGTL